MNDKEKRIEEMANIIADCRFTDPESEAIDLYNAKCRIIPEDSVVLTREEWAKMPKIEEIEKEYKEWAVDLLRVRFDLKPEAFDIHHKNNYSFENCADCLWNKIKGFIEELLWLRGK